MLKYLLIPYLTLASRFHGGGFFSAPRFLRDAVFAFPYALFYLHNPFHAAFALILADLGKNLGHEEFWLMGSGVSIVRNGPLSRLVSLFGLKRDSLAWCWTGMGLKGALTALGTLNPIIILGHALALPLAYQIGLKTKWDTVTAEFLSGFLYSLIILAGIHQW